MLHRTIQIKIKPVRNARKWKYADAYAIWSRELMSQIPKEFQFGQHLGVDLEGPHVKEFGKLLQSLVREKRAIPSEVFWLKERVTRDRSTPCEWYQLVPAKFAEPDRVSPLGIPQYKGVDQPRGVEAQSGLWVTDRFREFVESRGWKGISFLQQRDIGRYDSPTWHFAWSDDSIGRPLQHPWRRIKINDEPLAFDPAKIPSEPPEIRKILQLLKGMTCALDGVSRIVSEKSPPRHFARLPTDRSYLWRSWWVSGQQVPSYVPGASLGYSLWSSLVLRRSVKEELVKNGLLRESDCEGVRLYESRPKGWDFRFSDEDVSEPFFPPEFLKKVRLEEASVQDDAQRHPKPARKPTLKGSLALLKARRRADPGNVRKGATAKQLEALKKALSVPLPDAWLQVLKTSSHANIEECELASGEACEIISPDELTKFAASRAKEHPDLPKGFYPVVDSALGDVIGLKTCASQKSGECPVLFYSHEERDVTREWPTVAEFLEDLLAGTEVDDV